MITGNYKLAPNEKLWAQLVSGQVRLNCDTTNGPVNVELPAIKQIDEAYNVEIFVTDENNNAGTNNITVSTQPEPGAPVVRAITGMSFYLEQPALNVDGDQVANYTIGESVVLADFGANNGTRVITGVAINPNVQPTKTQITTNPPLNFVDLLPTATVTNTPVTYPNKINGANNVVINTNGGMALVKVASSTKFLALKG